MPDAQVGAEFDGARQEGSRLGLGDQLQDLGYVAGPSRTASGAGSECRAVATSWTPWPLRTVSQPAGGTVAPETG